MSFSSAVTSSTGTDQLALSWRVLLLALAVTVGALALSGVAQAQGLLSGLIAPEDQPLLEPEQAFVADVVAADDGSAVVSWIIADDYYMYRQRFAVTTDTPGVVIGELDIPGGKVKSDPAFGDVETYEKLVRIKVPMTGASGKSVSLKLAGQGCNEPVGVCYPPISHNAVLDLSTATASTEPAVNAMSTDNPPNAQLSTELPTSALAQNNSDTAAQSGGAWGSASSSSSSSISSLSELSTILGGGEPEFLDVDDAFQLDLATTDPTQVLADFVIADGYYLYRDQMSFKVDTNTISTLQPDFPAGKEKDDEFFGKTTVYYQRATVPVNLNRQNADAQSVTVTATYQGCADEGICYPPVTKKFSLQLRGCRDRCIGRGRD